MVVLGQQLALMVIRVFSNQNSSTILFYISHALFRWRRFYANNVKKIWDEAAQKIYKYVVMKA